MPVPADVVSIDGVSRPPRHGPIGPVRERESSDLVLVSPGPHLGRRPWVVIGLWALVAIVVIVSSGVFGRDMEDSFTAPGVDSQIAVDLLSSAGSDRAGVT